MIFFQRSEEELYTKYRKHEPIDIVCPFCKTPTEATNIGWEESHTGEHSWDFVAKCKPCGINLTINVAYHETIVQPIGGEPTRIFPE